MTAASPLPHVELFERGLRISHERFMGGSRIAVDAALLRHLIHAALSGQPFDAEFYRRTYPDIAAAEAAGAIPDLHRHFLEQGWYEGRFGAPPPVDEAFYVMTYPDVGRALRAGDIVSAQEHYVRAGAAEGRIPAPGQRARIEAWTAALGLGSG